MDSHTSAEGNVTPGPAADEERLRAILETAREAIVTADASGHIVDFNPAAERMFDLSAADAMGASLTTLMPERFHAAHEAGLRRFLETREPKVIGHTVELGGRRADGEEFPLELSLVAFELKGQLFFTGVLSDITQRKRDEAYRNAQHELSGILMEAPSVRAAVTQLMRTLGERLGWQWGAYWAVDETGGRIRCQAIWHDPDLDPTPFVQATREAELERGEGLPGRAWASGAVAWIEDVVEDANFPRADAAAEAGLHAAVAVPFRRSRVVVGVLELLSTDARPSDDALVGVLSAIGDQVGQFIERKRAERERAAYRTGLERSIAELEQFAYVASHDLQEPLRSIGGFAQLLEQRYQGKLDDEGDRFIGLIVAGVNRMQSLIDDLLLYSRSGKAELRKEEADAGEIVQTALGSLDAAVRETEAEIELGQLPTISADTRALVQVFQNLLSNGLKFNASRPPRVEISAEPGDAGWTFAVADNGIGIDAAQMQTVFGMFQRLHGSEDYGGTGIGLAICKRTIERHGGRIWCEPRSEGGTVFRFTIPDA